MFKEIGGKEYVNKTSLPLLLFLRGLPGSGKTKLAEGIKNSSTFMSGSIIIDPDQINTEDQEYISFCDELKAKNIQEIYFKYRFLLNRVLGGLKNRKNVIWNQPWSSIQGIEDTMYNTNYHLALQSIAEKPLKPKFSIIEIIIPPAIALERVNKRKSEGGHGPTPQTFFNKFVDSFQEYSSNKNIPILRLDGLNNTDNMLKIALFFLESIGK